MWLAARSQKKHDWLGAGGALPIVKMSDGLPAIPAPTDLCGKLNEKM